MGGDELARLEVLGSDAHFDVVGAPATGEPVTARPASGSPPERPHRHGDIKRHVCTYQHPKGAIKVLGVLQTNACANDCHYCPFRAGREYRREAFSPPELARLTDQLYRARVIEGLFLSSGVVGHGDYTMEQIVATGELLRHRFAFPGYLHLKLMPGASDAAIEAALRVADRVSVNLEAPNAARLAQLAPGKDLATDLLAPLRRVQAMVSASGRHVSRSTQFVVGPAGESDRELLDTAHVLYRRLGLSRVYYSAFRPVPDTPLADTPAEEPRRQDRLYQADALVRLYRFDLTDLAFDENGRLPLAEDPKLAWARVHPEHFPVEVNRAGRRELLRVPGLGIVSVEAILRARSRGRLRHEEDLRRLGVQTRRAADWITIDGHSPPRQMALALSD